MLFRTSSALGLHRLLHRFPAAALVRVPGPSHVAPAGLVMRVAGLPGAARPRGVGLLAGSSIAVAIDLSARFTDVDTATGTVTDDMRGGEKTAKGQKRNSQGVLAKAKNP